MQYTKKTKDQLTFLIECGPKMWYDTEKSNSNLGIWGPLESSLWLYDCVIIWLPVCNITSMVRGVHSNF